MGMYLPKATLTKKSSSAESPTLNYALSGMQGWRPTMEDAHICQLNVKEGVHVFGVFDGHGGPEVSAFCAEVFISYLMASKTFKSGDYKAALEETFLKMDELMMSAEGQKQLRVHKKNPKNQARSSAGCTANVCILTPTNIFCANAGDSRAYLCYSNGNILPLSRDHKPELQSERCRIIAANGFIVEGRVNGNLNLSRALGDLEFKANPALRPEEQIISGFPEVMSVQLDIKPLFLLIGCDGIWETESIKEICDKITIRISAKLKLQQIVDETLDRLVATDPTSGLGCDNMTLILIQFK